METRSFDEPAGGREAGSEYFRRAMVHGAVTVDTMERMDDMLRKHAGNRALLHCSSGNRTAAALIPYLIKEEGMEEEEAVDVAMRSGLRSAELMELALEYARRLGV